MGQKPLVGIITGILPGTDGTQRMSKSTGNIVPINTGAEDMYGKLMSLPDFAMGKYMRLATRWSPHEIEMLEKEVASGQLHPRDAKMKMAFEIVSIFYGDTDAWAARNCSSSGAATTKSRPRSRLPPGLEATPRWIP